MRLLQQPGLVRAKLRLGSTPADFIQAYINSFGPPAAAADWWPLHGVEEILEQAGQVLYAAHRPLLQSIAVELVEREAR